MPPHSSSYKIVNAEAEESYLEREQDVKELEYTSNGYFLTDIKWANTIAIVIFHLAAIYSVFTFPYVQNFKTFLFLFIYGNIGAYGITLSIHRCFTHRSYKARAPLKVILLMLFAMSGQNSVFDWVRDHRIHHKYSESSADPHNSTRGFFFAHLGWLMLKKHPEVVRRGKQVDMSDILEDPIVQFFDQNFLVFKFFFAFFIPIVVPMYYWDEKLYTSILGNIGRYCLAVNGTFVVNSFAHLYGKQPYNKGVRPRENLFATFITSGEGWHNYHHTFPWDYKTSERGKYNITTVIIDICAKLGLAYDLKEPSAELLKRVIQKHGDGSHETTKNADIQLKNE